MAVAANDADAALELLRRPGRVESLPEFELIHALHAYAGTVRQRVGVCEVQAQQSHLMRGMQEMPSPCICFAIAHAACGSAERAISCLAYPSWVNDSFCGADLDDELTVPLEEKGIEEFDFFQAFMKARYDLDNAILLLNSTVVKVRRCIQGITESVSSECARWEPCARRTR